jgi:hypothetical protein
MCAEGDIQGVNNRGAMRLAMDPHNQPTNQGVNNSITPWLQSQAPSSSHAPGNLSKALSMVSRVEPQAVSW